MQNDVTQSPRAQTAALGRLDDLLDAAERGRLAVSPFLTPAERAQAQRDLRAKGRGGVFFFGGYADAERTRLYCLPEYLELPDEDDREAMATFCRMLADDESDGVVVLSLRGSGFCALRHKDYLGAILALGLERDAMGDLLVMDEHSARLFCTPVVAAFLSETLTQVASDTVRVERLPYDPDFAPVRATEPVNDTVASPRLDCVVAALANLSREEAQKSIRAGLVAVDDLPVNRTDLLLTPPVLLTVRGAGKFRLLEIGEANRRGRLRMRAEKFI